MVKSPKKLESGLLEDGGEGAIVVAYSGATKVSPGFNLECSHVNHKLRNVSVFGYSRRALSTYLYRMSQNYRLVKCIAVLSLVK